jgi:hypothetical protein
MKYKQRDELVAGLRELADFIEEKGLQLPELTVEVRSYVSDYEPKNYTISTGYGKQVMRKAAIAMKPVEKIHDSYSFRLKRTFGSIVMQVSTSREAVCRKVSVTKVEMPEQVIPAYVREVPEWVCTDPLLTGER